MSLQRTLSRETTVLVYTQAKISEGRGLCGFNCMENGCGDGHGQIKSLFVRKQSKTKHSPLWISTSCLETVSEVRGTSSQGKNFFPKISDQLPREQRVSVLTSCELWTLLALSSLPPWEMRSLWRKSSLFHEIFTLEKGRSFVYCHWPLEGGGRNCNQVSRSQFSQLHIITWFRYLIHALKLKTCLELTIALLSHRLLCREIHSACLSAAINPGTDHVWKHFVLNTIRKGKE